MPCNSEHCEPRRREEESRQVASHICYLWGKLNLIPRREVVDAAGYLYGDEHRCDWFTEMLCTKIRSLTAHQQTEYIYDGRNPIARKLADWWDAHKAHDEKREAELFKNVQRDPAEVAASMLNIKEVQEAIDNDVLTEEDVAEEARKLCEWIDQKVLDSQVT